MKEQHIVLWHKLQAWTEQHQHFPRQTGGAGMDLEEQHLGQFLNRMTSIRPSPEVLKWVKQHPEWQNRTLHKGTWVEIFPQIVAHSQKHGKFPAASSKDPHEKWLGQCLGRYRFLGIPEVIQWCQRHPEYQHFLHKKPSD